MQVRVLSHAAEAALHPPQGAAVIIDVLRATSVMTAAIANGARAIYPAVEIDEARELSTRWSRTEILLAGERNALPIAGFDLGNSPLSVTPDIVHNKIIIMTTSNGTRALNAARSAAAIYIGSLLNVDAVAAELCEHEEVTLFCAGTHNRLDIADSMAAGAIIHRLRCRSDIALNVDDLGLLCEAYYNPQSYRQRIRESVHGQNLLRLGLEDDLEYCCRLNLFTTVPCFDGEKII